MDYDDEERQRKSFLDKLKAYLSDDSEHGPNPKYKRKLMDSRIEKYLDENFQSFVDEYELLTNVDSLAYEERYDELTYRVQRIGQYQKDTTSKLDELEKRIKALK